MSYMDEELAKMDITDFEEARKKIVDLSVFDNIYDISLNDKTKRNIDFTRELYIEYLDDLKTFKETTREQVLKALMNTETIDNHSLERENSNLLIAYSETHHSTAIRYLLKKLLSENNGLDSEIIRKTHEILMRGTSRNGYINPGFRKSNISFVCHMENGERIITFFPISYHQINEAIRLFCAYFNDKTMCEEDLFIKPFVVHGLLAALQVFEDGNTRLSRTLQHVKLHELTNQLLDNEFLLPTIYFSKNYMPFRDEYRALIRYIALKPNNETWNEWINFNMCRLQERIYANNYNFSTLTRKKLI